MRTGAEPVPYHEHSIEHDRFDGISNQITDNSTPVMQAGLSMVVWILKREVRAIGGCLGIHRR
jgi:hypothetical protein